MVRGCEKDPSFARGRNLVTYAADLTMKPNSRKSFLSGVLILGALLRPKHRWSGQAGVIKQVLTVSASFSHVVRQLLETFGPTSPYSSEIREEAARIVELVARSIRLEQFPGVAIHCVSSLLDTFDEYIWWPGGCERKVDIPKECDRDWLFEEYDEDYLEIDGVPRPKAAEGESPESDRHRLLHGYKALVVVGLRILQKLAVHADNCMVISSTEGLVLKTMAHLTSGHLHRDHHDEWCGIAVESLKLMTGLMAAPGETGTKLQHQISGSMEAVISTSESVMDCPDCDLLLKRQTVQVLLDMSADTSSIIAASESRKKGSYIRKLAGGKLQSVLSLQSEGSETRMLQSLGAVAGDLVSRTIVDAIDNSHRLHAVHILIDLCRRYTERGVFLEGLKNGITNVLPKILQEIIGCGSTSEEIQVVTEENNDQVWAAPGADIEKGDVSQGRGQENASSQQQNGNEQPEDSKVQEALISLCMVIIENWIGKDQDVTRRFDNITSRLCSEQGMPVKTFAPLVTEVCDELLKGKKMLKDW
ncbi:hypothetical protein C2845_PM06G30690 [Panicum miliaceum]|uniref:Uncharacterized protein n=1 Tax=Panicum miliaceum TaxID=4540 RepID=A0A3L6RB52_PANMI|nr:hypothetical protein C2845_PM06G30690 [Panicum miliaceum]